MRQLCDLAVLRLHLRCAAAGAAQPRRRRRKPLSTRAHRRRRRSDDASGDDDVLRRHWPLVCADGRGSAARQVVGERLPARTSIDNRATPTSRTSRRRSRSAMKDRAEIFGVVRSSTRGSTATCGRCSSDGPDVAGGVVDRYPLVRPGLERRQLGDFCGSARNSICCRSGGSSRRRLRCAGWSSCRPARRDAASAPGKTDFALDAIVSKEINERVEVSGYGGFESAASPDGRHDERRSAGASAPGSRRASALRFTAEFEREQLRRTTRWRPSDGARSGSDGASRRWCISTLTSRSTPHARGDVAGEERVLRRRRRSTGRLTHGHAQRIS